MTTVREFHQQAMEFAELAFLSRHRGDLANANEYFLRAFEYEEQAAKVALFNNVSEPTLSVLHRSAASLALECGEYRAAERLVCIALSNDPPVEIANELREVFEKVNFHRHLALRGVELQEGEFQIAMTGNSIASGLTLSEVFIERVQDTETLIYRTIERQRGLNFREKGRVKKSIADPYSLYMYAPRAGSFAVTLRLGNQRELPGEFSESNQVIDEVLSCLELVDSSQEHILRQRIEQDAYYRNFVALARKLAPDGENVSMVGFTAIREGKEKSVSLTRSRGSIPLVPNVSEIEETKPKGNEPTVLTGLLRFADKLKGNQIKILDDEGNSHNFNVPEGLMNDIVRPLWDTRVTVVGVGPKRSLTLVNIEPSDD